MPRFSKVFGLTNTQAELDFVDIDLATDTPLYIDPYAIQIRADEFSEVCTDHIHSYFNALLDALRARNDVRATNLLSNLREPNETFLGQSVGRPRGRAVGAHKAAQLAQAFRESQAFETGLLSDLSEAALFIYGVGSDTISDLTTNILRNLLAKYTKEQCEITGSLHSLFAILVRFGTLSAVIGKRVLWTYPSIRDAPSFLCPNLSYAFGSAWTPKNSTITT